MTQVKRKPLPGEGMVWQPADNDTLEVVNKSHAFLFYKVMGRYNDPESGKVSHFFLI